MVSTRAMNSSKPKLSAKALENLKTEKLVEQLCGEVEDEMEQIIEMEEPEIEAKPHPDLKRAKSPVNLSVSPLVQVGDFKSVVEKPVEEKISTIIKIEDDEPAAKKRRPSFFPEEEAPIKPSQRVAAAREKIAGVQDKVLAILKSAKETKAPEYVGKPIATKAPPTIDQQISRVTGISVHPKPVFQAPHTMPRVVRVLHPSQQLQSRTTVRPRAVVNGRMMPPPPRGFSMVPSGHRMMRQVFPHGQAPYGMPPVDPRQFVLPERSFTKEVASVVSEMKCIQKREDDRIGWAKINKRCKVGPILDIDKIHKLGQYSPRSFTSLQLALVQDLINSAKVPRHALQLLKGSENGPHLKVMVDHNGEILSKKMPIFLSKLSMFLYVREFLVTLKCCPNLVISADRECDVCLPNCNEDALSDDIAEIVPEKVTDVNNEFERLQKQGAHLMNVYQTAEEYRRRLGDNVAQLIIENEIDSSILQYIDVETLRGQMRISEALALRIVSIAMELRAQSHESVLFNRNRRS